MSSIAGRIALAAFAGALAASSALAADVSGRRVAGPPPEAVACRGPETVTAHFEEQVCSRGVSGYAECRWVKREHDVMVGERCTAKITGETAHLATRGAFPPYPRIGGRD